MSDDAGEIIVKGGSIRLEYDDGVYEPEPGDPKIHKNQDRRITRILVVDDESGAQKYDSGEHNDGLRWTLTVSTK